MVGSSIKESDSIRIEQIQKDFKRIKNSLGARVAIAYDDKKVILNNVTDIKENRKKREVSFSSNLTKDPLREETFKLKSLKSVTMIRVHSRSLIFREDIN